MLALVRKTIPFIRTTDKVRHFMYYDADWEEPSAKKSNRNEKLKYKTTAMVSNGKPIPEGISTVKVSKILPELPQSAKHLIVHGSLVIIPPKYGKGLKSITITPKSEVSLSPSLPSSLRELYCGEGSSFYTHKLPPFLKTLHAATNTIDIDKLPDSLESFRMSSKTKVIGRKLPNGLKDLVSHNGMDMVEAPPNLRSLELHHDFQTAIIPNLPLYLESLVIAKPIATTPSVTLTPFVKHFHININSNMLATSLKSLQELQSLSLDFTKLGINLKDVDLYSKKLSLSGSFGLIYSGVEDLTIRFPASRTTIPDTVRKLTLDYSKGLSDVFFIPPNVNFLEIIGSSAGHPIGIIGGVGVTHLTLTNLNIDGTWRVPQTVTHLTLKNSVYNSGLLFSRDIDIVTLEGENIIVDFDRIPFFLDTLIINDPYFNPSNIKGKLSDHVNCVIINGVVNKF